MSVQADMPMPLAPSCGPAAATAVTGSALTASAQVCWECWGCTVRFALAQQQLHWHAGVALVAYGRLLAPKLVSKCRHVAYGPPCLHRSCLVWTTVPTQLAVIAAVWQRCSSRRPPHCRCEGTLVREVIRGLGHCSAWLVGLSGRM